MFVFHNGFELNLCMHVYCSNSFVLSLVVFFCAMRFPSLLELPSFQRLCNAFGPVTGLFLSFFHPLFLLFFLYFFLLFFHPSVFSFLAVLSVFLSFFLSFLPLFLPSFLSFVSVLSLLLASSRVVFNCLRAALVLLSCLLRLVLQ